MSRAPPGQVPALRASRHLGASAAVGNPFRTFARGRPLIARFLQVVTAVVAALVLLLAACSAPPTEVEDPGSTAGGQIPAVGSAPVGSAPLGSAVVARAMTVYRSPDCSCCHVWADIARREGWTVATVDVIDMTEFKARHGIPADAQSCHTAIVDGYVVEGHVPLAAVDRLLAERPQIDGIGLPGMPAGSPGMGGVAAAPFEVLALDGGETSVFGSY